MKLIDAEQKVNIIIFDEQTDDRKIETMTIEEILDNYTDEGCPESYFEGNWIPYSKQPPKKEGRYLITVDEDGERDVHDDFFYFRADGTPSWYLAENVVAWMQLPQPYKK